MVPFHEPSTPCEPWVFQLSLVICLVIPSSWAFQTILVCSLPISLRHLALTFLLPAKLFFIPPWALPPAFIVSNIVSVNKSPHNFIYSKQSFYYLYRFFWSGIQEGPGFARHLSHCYRNDPGWSWEEGRGQLGIVWSSLHGLSGQKLKDGEKYRMVVLQR